MHVTFTAFFRINVHNQHNNTMREDLTYGEDARGDHALFIDEKHFLDNGWKLDNTAKEAAGSLTFFRVISGGEEQSGHGWIEDGEIVQWG